MPRKKNDNSGITTLFILFAIAVGIASLIYNCSGKQSGKFSRYGMGNAELEAPEDCVKILNVGRSQTVKYITYVNTENKVIMQEYSDLGIFEATYEITNYEHKE